MKLKTLLSIGLVSPLLHGQTTVNVGLFGAGFSGSGPYTQSIATNDGTVSFNLEVTATYYAADGTAGTSGSAGLAGNNNVWSPTTGYYAFTYELTNFTDINGTADGTNETLGSVNFTQLSFGRAAGPFDYGQYSTTGTAGDAIGDITWGSSVTGNNLYSGLSGTTLFVREAPEYQDGGSALTAAQQSSYADTETNTEFENMFDIDDIRLAVVYNSNPIPEPTSVALLGLGGLAVLARRKRS